MKWKVITSALTLSSGHVTSLGLRIETMIWRPLVKAPKHLCISLNMCYSVWFLVETRYRITQHKSVHENRSLNLPLGPISLSRGICGSVVRVVQSYKRRDGSSLVQGCNPNTAVYCSRSETLDGLFWRCTASGSLTAESQTQPQVWIGEILDQMIKQGYRVT